MLELNIYQNQNESAETFGKWYARVENKEQMLTVAVARPTTPRKVSRRSVQYVWQLKPLVNSPRSN